jgi:intein-encoded DNA endonuclease-like protein
MLTWTLSTDLRLLIHVRELLNRLGVETTGPKLHIRRGTIICDRRTGKRYPRDKDVYAIYIRARSNEDFYRHVGFTSRRKQTRLEEYAKRRPTPPPPFYHPASLRTTPTNN